MKAIEIKTGKEVNIKFNPFKVPNVSSKPPKHQIKI